MRQRLRLVAQSNDHSGGPVEGSHAHAEPGEKERVDARPATHVQHTLTW
jgi:hypothetical protein